MTRLRSSRWAALTACSLLCATALAWGAEPAPSLDQDADACVAAPPEPTLRSGAYRAQSFVRARDNRAQESATLPSGVRIAIEYGGCVDAVSREFELERPDAPHIDPSDTSAWANFARDTLTSLDTAPERRWFDPALLGFLESVSRRPRFEGRYERCADGSTPTADGCAFDTGGGYYFELNAREGAPTVVVGQYDLL